MTAILGISAFYHDSAAALVVDGDIVAAAQEERFTRKKHDADFPQHAIEYCLNEAKLAPEEIDYVGFYDKPILKFDRLLETYLAFGPQGFRSFVQAMPLWLKKKLHLPREMNRGMRGAFRKRHVFTHHHESHAASAFFPSPFEEAAILTLDGVGEWSTTTLGTGRGNQVELRHELRFPHSIGLLYSAFTYFTGFKVNSDEYKLMGLAPYGEPAYYDVILDEVVHLQDDGSIHMDLSYFNYCQGLTMTSKKFDALFGGPPRALDGPITQREMDIAASIQKVTEEIVLRCAQHLHRETRMKKLCMAGGVALNCVANGRVLREGPFEDVWIQPAAGDAGGALGVALFVWYQLLGNPRTPNARDSQKGSLLGPRFDDGTIQRFLDGTRAPYQRVADDAALCDAVASALEDGKVVGWFQGRMEFGPRALGARSILGDARRPEMQSRVNIKVKFREGFRPFAPVVLREHVHEWFETRPEEDSPYMLLVAPVHASKRVTAAAGVAPLTGLDKLKERRSEIPAVTHVDDSARIQTVDAERHGLYHQLLESFHRRTGCPVLVNTSFNLGWDPIVCTPRDAYETFMSCNIDVLCMGHFLLEKEAQPAWVGDATAAATPGATEAHAATDARAASGHEVVRRLLDRSRRDPFWRALDSSLPYNSTVLVVGLGSGEFASALAVACRRIVGIDADDAVVRAAESFRRSAGLSRARFETMEVKTSRFEAGSFGAVLWQIEARPSQHRGRASSRLDGQTLQHLASLLAPGGYLVARTAASARHVLHALDSHGLELVRRIPSLVPGDATLHPGKLFERQPRGTSLDHGFARLASGRRNRAPIWVACRR